MKGVGGGGLLCFLCCTPEAASESVISQFWMLQTKQWVRHPGVTTKTNKQPHNRKAVISVAVGAFFMSV